MNKIITIFIFLMTIGMTQSTMPSALLDFSDYSDQEEVDRPIERFLGLNPYNIVGFYTYSWDIGNNESRQRDVDLHWGSSMVILNGAGVNVKQYWLSSKYKAISYFTSISSSFAIILGMGRDGVQAIDVHSLASGVDFNVVRFNSFDIRFSMGLQALGSFAWKESGAMPFMNISLRSGK